MLDNFLKNIVNFLTCVYYIADLSVCQDFFKIFLLYFYNMVLLTRIELVTALYQSAVIAILLQEQNRILADQSLFLGFEPNIAISKLSEDVAVSILKLVPHLGFEPRTTAPFERADFTNLSSGALVFLTRIELMTLPCQGNVIPFHHRNKFGGKDRT